VRELRSTSRPPLTVPDSDQCTAARQQVLSKAIIWQLRPDACHVVVATDQDIRPLIAGYPASLKSPMGLTRLGSVARLSRPPTRLLGSTDLASVVAYIMSLRHRHADLETH